MASNHSSDSNAEITLGLLKAVHDDDELTQRSAAQDLGIALGLVNTYLKRCIKKGYVKVRQVPRNRYAYYLTPKGFAEKSRLTAEFLSQSLSLFRQAQTDFGSLLSQCAERGWGSIALYGQSDLVAIVTLFAANYPVRVIGVVESAGGGNGQNELPVIDLGAAKAEADVFFVTDLRDPQRAFDALKESVESDRILTPGMLEIARTPDLRRRER